MPHDDLTELFYLVDKDDKVLGSISRREAHSDSTKIHRAVYVVATNSKNQLLLQHRSKHKDMFPGYWTVSASGHVTYGETYEEAAVRELKEELGVESSLALVTKELIQYGQETEYSAIYQTQIDVVSIRFDPTEVSEVKWVDLDKLSKFVETEAVTPGGTKVLKTLGYI